jgi:2-octaprenylphenol hydroxylase
MRHVQKYSGPSWIILGDAAHTIHPLAGLGLNVGLADVSSWMQCLEAKGPLCSTKRLSAYQRERKHAVWQTILLMEGLKRIFNSSLAPLSVLRGWGLRACNGVNSLKRLLIEQACGLSGKP